MSSFFVLSIFVSVLVLVHCQEFYHEGDVQYHKYVDNKACRKADITANRRNGALKPRERLVTLKPEPGFEFFPRAVSVKRCNGHCPGHWSPMPTKTEARSFAVHLHREGAPMKCVSVEVLEHQACRCMCMKTEESCIEKQYWDESECDCPCREREILKPKCEAKPGMVWDDEDCECRCVRGLIKCRSGMTWNKDLCECMPAY